MLGHEFPVMSKSFSDDNLSEDDDITLFTNWTTAGKHTLDLRSRAQEELFKKLHDTDFDVELSPPSAKKTKGRKRRSKDSSSTGVENALIVSLPQESETVSPPLEVAYSSRRITRSQHGRGRGSDRSRGHNKRDTLVMHNEDLTASDDDRPSPVPGVISKLLPRPKILEGSPIYISDDSNEDVSFSSLLVEEEDINYEVSVKVRWRFNDIHKFKIRKFQKFTSIFEFFSKLENAPEDQIYLTLNDNIIVPSDSPDSLQLSIVNIIDGSILVEKPINPIARTQCQSPISKDSIQLKVCTKDSKELIPVRLRKTEKMMVLMSKISEELGKPLEVLKFLFDGEPLNPNETPDDLELEGDELIELRIASS